MAEKVDRDLCDERSGNIQNSLKEIKKELIRIWEGIDKIGKLNACNGMSTKKVIALMTGISVIIYSIAELIKAFR